MSRSNKPVRYSVTAYDDQATVLGSFMTSSMNVLLNNELDADIKLDVLADGEALSLHFKDHHCNVFRISHGKILAEECLNYGSVFAYKNLHLLVLQSFHDGAEESRREFSSETSNLPARLLQYAKSRPSSTKELRLFLEGYLREIVAAIGAKSAMLIARPVDDFEIVSTHGMTLKQAEDVWNQLPDDMPRQVLSQSAEVILPKAFAGIRKDDATTVYVHGVRSVVGFPLVADQEVLGYLYFNFDNFLLQLTESIQNQIIVACQILCLILQRAYLQDQVADLNTQNAATTGLQNLPVERIMIGESMQIQQLYSLLLKLAPTDVPVLIHGETGTGKELVARELHRLSTRAKANFVAFNAAALPEHLLESELFGHVKGAFTGAINDRQGLIEKAANGTLFIDEIGDLPLALQAKLLRVLQEKQVHPLGGNRAKDIDFRIVAATHNELKAKISDGSFREDLYYRIAGIVVEVAPLRERRDDIMLLANFFKSRFVLRNKIADKQWSATTITQMKSYGWPGNVRELEHVVARAVIMASGTQVTPDDLGLRVVQRQGASLDGDVNSSGLTFDEAKDIWMKHFLESALAENAGNRTQTAKALHVAERTLFRYLEQLGIH